MSEKIEISKKSIVPADLEKTPSSNHIVKIVKAAISGIPIIGGPISSLVNDYIPTLTSSNHRVHILPNYPIKSDFSS